MKKLNIRIGWTEDCKRSIANLTVCTTAILTQASNILVNNHEVPQEELLTITVEIGNGEKENIVVLTTDTPEDVADRFWRKYDMNDELRDIFVEQIAQNIEQVKREMQSDCFSDVNQKEQASTAIDTSPPLNSFSDLPLQQLNNRMHNIQK